MLARGEANTLLLVPFYVLVVTCQRNWFIHPKDFALAWHELTTVREQASRPSDRTDNESESIAVCKPS